MSHKSEITIREYKSSDRGRLTLCIQALKDLEAYFDADYLHTEESSIILSNQLESDIKNKQGKIFVAEKGRELVGFISCHVDLKNDPLIFKKRTVLYISNLIVLEQFRSQGLGKKLIEKTESYAKDLNINQLKLIIFNKNQKALDFYTRNGFGGYEMAMLKKVD